MQITAPAAPLTVVARRAYPSPLKAARPSSDSLRSPTPGRLASVNLAARQFLAIAYFASLVTASDLAALTALYLLRENLYLFPLSDFAGQKTKLYKKVWKKMRGCWGRRKKHIKRRVERQKVFSSPHAANHHLT